MNTFIEMDLNIKIAICLPVFIFGSAAVVVWRDKMRERRELKAKKASKAK